MDENHADYGLLVSFPDESTTFTYGFEAGMLWERMQSGVEAEFSVTTRIENREVIQRLATERGWSADVTPTDVEGYDTTAFERKPPVRSRMERLGLRIVKDDDHG